MPADGLENSPYENNAEMDGPDEDRVLFFELLEEMRLR